MAGLAYDDFDSLPDVLLANRFEVLFAPPGSTNTNEVLALRCAQITVPAEQTEVTLVGIQGLEFNYRGRRVYDKAINAMFYETVDGALQNAIRPWTQQIVGASSGNGASKKNYAVQGSIGVVDQSGNTALLFLVDNAWPSDIQQVPLDGQNTAAPYAQNLVITFDRLRPPNGIAMA